MRAIGIKPWLAALALIAGSTACLGAAEPGILQPVTEYGGQVANLFWLVLAICGAVFCLVAAIMVTVFFRFRARKGRTEGGMVRGSMVLEMIWTAVPLALMVYLAWVSVDLVNLQLRPPARTLIVQVVAYQFGWDYEYFESVPNGTGSDLVTVRNICGNPAAMVTIRKLGVSSTNDFALPLGVPVRFLVSSRDVIHSFWIPDFLIKRDTVPGLVADMWMTPNRLGDFRVVCAALCGPAHSAMTGTVHVMDAAAFSAWMAAHAIPKEKPQ